MDIFGAKKYSTQIKPQVLFGTYYKAASGLVKTIQAFKIQVTTIHDVNTSGYDWNLIQDIDIMKTDHRKCE